MRLRWYQEEAVAAVWDYLRNNAQGAPCVVLPTGAGKTPVIAEMCRQVIEWGGRALVLAHVKELLEQSREKLALFVDAEKIGVFSAGLNEKTTHTPIIVASIQSAYAKAQELGAFQLVIVDEAHLIPPNGAGRYRRFLQDTRQINPQTRLVGLTATPYRLGCGWITKDRAGDEKDDYDRLLDAVVYEVETSKLIADGTLSCVVSCEAKRAPDFSSVHTVRGDFDEKEIEAILLKKNVLHAAAEEIVKKTKDRRKVVVFCNRRESARKCAKLLEEIDPNNAAAVVDGETGPNERAEIVRAFKSDAGVINLLGDVNKPLKYVCNVGVFTTGFDAPNVDAVAILRPTKSLTLYQQIVGRGLRRAPNKYNCLVLDYGGNIDRHGPIDLPRPEKIEVNAKPWKVCKDCGAVVAIGLQKCPLCGFEWPKKAPPNPNAGLDAKASGAAILSGQPAADVIEENAVLKVYYSVHYKKDSTNPPTVQIKYVLDGFKKAYEWICPGRSGWQRQKYEQWWAARSITAAPSSADLAAKMAEAGALATPLKIRLRTKAGARFPQITWVEQTEKPDFDEEKFLLTSPAFEDEENETCGFSEFNQFDEQLENLPF